MDPEYSYLNAAVVNMLAKITAVGGVFDAALQPVYFITGVLLLVFACIKFMWQRDLAPLAVFVINYVKLMCLIVISGQWMPLTSGYVSQMGSFGANAAGFNILQLAPGTVIVRALDVAWKMYSENLSWLRLIFGSTEDTIAHLLLALGCIGTILLSIFMAAWIMLFFVVFKLASIIALLFLAFMMFDATRFMAAPGLARILAYGVQMLVLGLSTGLFFVTLDALDLSGHLHVGQSIALLVVMFFFGLLFKYTTDLAREQISGMPSLDLHDGGRLGAQAVGAAAGMLGAVAAPALGTLGALKLAGRSGASLGGGAASSAGTALTGGASGGGGSSAAPSAAMRILNKPPIDATWTEARDLPKSATRMLEARRATLPPPPRQLPPPNAR